MTRISGRIAAAIAAGLIVATVATAQEVPASLRQCVAEPDSVRRLACFDRESARLMQQHDTPPAPTAAASTPSPTPAPSPALAPKPRTDEENFGFSGSKLAREEAYRKAAEDPGVQQLTATVTQVKTRPHGEFVVTLSNGQQWAQKEAEKSLSLSVGDQVSITPGALGSYYLKGPKRAATRVTRVK